MTNGEVAIFGGMIGLIVIILWHIKKVLEETLRVTKETNEWIQRGLQEQIAKNIKQQSDDAHKALLMKSKRS